MAKKKNHYKKEKETPPPEITVPMDEEGFSIDLSKVFTKANIMPLLPFFFMLALFLFIFFYPSTKFTDPWNVAVILVDSAFKVKDSDQKTKLLNEGGKMLTDLIQKLPMHARVNYFYGHYLSKKEIHDSALKYLMKAVKLDSGGTSNQVAHLAANEMLFSCWVVYSRLRGEGKLTNARKLLLESYNLINSTPDMPGLVSNFRDLTLLIAEDYRKSGMPDSAFYYYNKIIIQEPDNVPLLHLMGEICLQTGKYKSAVPIYDKILKLKPDDKVALQNNKFLQFTLGKLK